MSWAPSTWRSNSASSKHLNKQPSTCNKISKTSLLNSDLLTIFKETFFSRNLTCDGFSQYSKEKLQLRFLLACMIGSYGRAAYASQVIMLTLCLSNRCVQRQAIFKRICVSKYQSVIWKLQVSSIKDANFKFLSFYF